eukprot:230951_1
MSILYSVVARGTNVAVSYTLDGHSGNFKEVVEKMLRKLSGSASPEMMSYLNDDKTYAFNYIGAHGVIFMCMTDEPDNTELSESFLKLLSSLWFRSFGKHGDQPEIDVSGFAAELEKQMMITAGFREDSESESTGLLDLPGRAVGPGDTDAGSSRLVDLRRGVEEANSVAMQNIELAASRGEAMSTLVDKSENLHEASSRFNAGARRVRRRMWWQMVKSNLVILVG